MRASIRDIVAAIALGTIVYRARQISPLARLHRLRSLVSAYQQQRRSGNHPASTVTDAICRALNFRSAQRRMFKPSGARLIMIEHEHPYRRREIAVLALSIDAAD